MSEDDINYRGVVTHREGKNGTDVSKPEIQLHNEALKIWP